METVIKGYKRLGVYSIEEVLKHNKAIGGKDRDSRVKFGEHEVNMNSMRHQVFNESRVCCKCGIEGKIMALEGCKGQRPHFNMYAIDAEGNEVLMTKGSKFYPDGYETTCELCHNAWYAAFQAQQKEAAKCTTSLVEK